MLNSGTLEPTDKSRMLHVELIRPGGSILRHHVLETMQGMAFGQLVLPTSIPKDDIYRIRAYTRWSLNFNESYRFEKVIPVVQFKDDVWKGPKKAETKNYEWVRRPNGSYAWRRKAGIMSDGLQVTGQVTDLLVTRHLSPVTDIDLQFLPEGGRWVAGFPCRMAFRAVAPDGRGVNVEGGIVDDLGETVTGFRSLHQGMGSVFLAPQPGRRYQARMFNGHAVDLPAPDTTGVVMRMQPVGNDSIDLQIYFPPEVLSKGNIFHLVAQSRGVYATSWEIPAIRPRVAMRLPVEQLQTGIARFTLFNKDGIPCNERLVFVDKKDQIQLKVMPVSSALPRGEGAGGGLLKLLLQALDVDNLPVQGVFTVSVTDNLYGSHNTREANLYSQMLLSSDLSGKVENLGWYFHAKDSLKTEALDLVMRTHGWSGYLWEDIRNARKMGLPYTPERDYEVGHILTNNISINKTNENNYTRFSYTNTTQKGMVPNTDLKINRFDLGTSWDLFKGFKVNANVKYTKTTWDNNQGNDSKVDPRLWPISLDLNDLKDYWIIPGQEQKIWKTEQDNPYFALYENTNPYEKERWFSNMAVNYDFWSHFSIMGRMSYVSESQSPEWFVKPGSAGKDDGQDKKFGGYSTEMLRGNEINTDFLFSYDNRFFDDQFYIKASIGGNHWRQNWNNKIWGKTYQLLENAPIYTLGNYQVPAYATSNYGPSKIINSWYAFVNMSYKNRLYLDLTARNDWSSALPWKNNSYFYPSATFSAILSEMIDLPQVLSFWKVRASFAGVGNDTGAGQLQPDYKFTRGSGGIAGIEEGKTKRITDNLKPELTVYRTPFYLICCA